ncbi:FtsX-like permease family protein [Bacteroidota bacterium]
MKFRLLNYIAKRFSTSGNNRRFLNFARMVALISVILGSMALIISLSVLDGFEDALKSNAVKFTSHVKLRTFDNDSIENYETVLKKLRNDYEKIKKAAPVVEREGLVSSGGFVEGVIIRGTRPEDDITGMSTNIVEGRFAFERKRTNEIIIGRRLAKKMNAKIGSEIVLYAIRGESLSSFEMPEIEKFKVTGIYETGMAQYDDIYVYVPFDKTLDIFKMPAGSASSFDILLYNIEDAGGMADTLNENLGYPYYAYTVFDLHSAMFAWIELQKAPIPLVLGLISIVAVFNIVTILLITVVEKTHSIGILRALGMSRKNIIRIFIIQGITIGTVGTLIGCGIGLALGLIQQTYNIFTLQGDVYFLDSLPIKFSPWHFIAVISAALILSFLATLIPSLIASKIKPIRAIRFK